MNRDEYNELVLRRGRDLLAEMQADLDSLVEDGYDGEFDDDDYDMDLEDAIDLAVEAIEEHAGQQEIDRLIDIVAAIYNSHYSGVPGPEYTIPSRPAHPRDVYNAGILEEAEASQRANVDNNESDTELDAQIGRVRRLRDAGDLIGWDGAVTHLRQMLTISYADDYDLPAVVLRD